MWLGESVSEETYSANAKGHSEHSGAMVSRIDWVYYYENAK